MFDLLADELYDCVVNNNHEYRCPFLPDYGFEWVSYDGTQSNNPKTSHQGFFDILVVTGNRFPGNVTHHDILSAILEEDLLDEATMIWEGGHPTDITDDFEHLEILTTLSLLMFEQEVNWGRKNVIFQRHSPYYHPYAYQSRYNERRPRDQIMAYIEWSFAVGDVDQLEYWLLRTGGTTLSPSDPRDRFGGLHPTLNHYREQHSGADFPPLMVGQNLERFSNLASQFPQNPDYP